MPNPLSVNINAAIERLRRAEHCDRTNQPRLAALYRACATDDMAQASQHLSGL